MLPCRLLGLVLIAGALVALGADGLRSLQQGALAPQAVGELWYLIDPASLNLLQAVVQRYLWPWLWDPAAIWLLRLPSWLILVLLGLALRLACRRRARPRSSARR
jgi:hypothetical protein